MTPQEALEDATGHGDLAGIKKAISDGADPKSTNSWALRLAAMKSHTECVRFLLPLSSPDEADSEALRWAASEGNAECVRLLMPFSDCDAGDSYALRWAMTNKHIECARLVIPFSDTVEVREQIPQEDLIMYDSLVQETKLRKKHDISRQDRNATGL